MNEFLKYLLDNQEVLFLYQFGSSVYGNHSPEDTDYIVVTTNDFIIPKEYRKYKYQIRRAKDKFLLHNLKFEGSDFVFYKLWEWMDMGVVNAIENYECASLSRKFILKEFVKIPITFDPLLLRQEVLNTYAGSISRAMMLHHKGDTYGERKSLWHALRVIIFGLQILENKRIINYKAANKYYDSVMSGKNMNSVLQEYLDEFKSKTEGVWKKFQKDKVLAKCDER